MWQNFMLCCVRHLRGTRKKALVQWETMFGASCRAEILLSWETMRTCLDGYWMGNRTSAAALLFGTQNI